MSYKLTILGCSSAIPTVDKNPTAQLLNANERFFLIDCAEGTQVQLRKYKIKFQKISRIFISHLHGDHYFGLIGLLSSMHLLGRDKELHIYAHPELKKIIDIQLDTASTELCYPLFFHTITPDIDEVLFEDKKIKISTFPLNHGIDCNGFLFEEKLAPRKLLSEKVQEYNIPIDKLKEIKQGSDFTTTDGIRIDNIEITKENRIPDSYAFCSDTKYHEEIVDKIKNVTLLYHETTFMQDRSERANETNHSTTIDAANIANLSSVKNLLIGHFSQRYQDKGLLLNEVRSIFDKSIVASEGLTIDFSDL
ncbi:MAG: ribonuclease Z [Flavobacteriales bacterium]|mgnify:FL=1|jgi:ribonuclease Z|nr:ribonuclease Z [Flavobacteriales bacterium]